jgi:hypothetical protein
LLVGLVAMAALAAGGTQARSMNPVKRNATIDFASLPGIENKIDYTLRLKLVAEGDVTTSVEYNIGAGTGTEGIRGLVKGSLERTWKVREIGTTTLEIEGCLGKEKLHRVQKVEAECPGFPKKNQPVVKQASN